MGRARHEGSKHGIAHLFAQSPYGFEVTLRKHSTQMKSSWLSGSSALASTSQNSWAALRRIASGIRLTE
jgi:hypothetical protein